MHNHCEEVLHNIQKTLHECRDNQKMMFISGIVNLHNCDNIKRWSDDVYSHVQLKMDIKNPILKDKYKIKYVVNKRLVVIE